MFVLNTRTKKIHDARNEEAPCKPPPARDRVELQGIHWPSIAPEGDYAFCKSCCDEGQIRRDFTRRPKARR